LCGSSEAGLLLVLAFGVTKFTDIILVTACCVTLVGRRCSTNLTAPHVTSSILWLIVCRETAMLRQNVLPLLAALLEPGPSKVKREKDKVFIDYIPKLH
jgi:hypothetical protein